jgi:hypothetical protein
LVILENKPDIPLNITQKFNSQVEEKTSLQNLLTETVQGTVQ